MIICFLLQMIGIGTNKVDLLSHKYSFSSFLGLDENSWGYSFHALKQNNGCMKYYGKEYNRGCIIGVYLDLFKGHLEFFINRRYIKCSRYYFYKFITLFITYRSQGIAYTNIPIPNDENGIALYPLVCSTSGKSSMKLINSCAVSGSLQFDCMKILCKNPCLVQVISMFTKTQFETIILFFKYFLASK